MLTVDMAALVAAVVAVSLDIITVAYQPNRIRNDSSGALRACGSTVRTAPSLNRSPAAGRLLAWAVIAEPSGPFR